MAITFDRCLEILLRVCHEQLGFGPQVKKACVVRDLQGRLRLALQLDPCASPPLDSRDLSGKLKQALSGYFVPPILCTNDDAPARKNLARNLLDKGRPWPEQWPRSYKSPIGETIPISLGNWFAYQAVLSKDSWLSESPSEPPWPLKEQTPAIIAFYSFKGGVGRSTLLASVAWNLAKKDKRVVVLDLDLEAPGLGTLLLTEQTGRALKRGVLDLIVDHLATNEIQLDSSSAPADALGANLKDKVEVFPAGQMNWSFLEKLARLDFACTTDQGSESPVSVALRALLKQIKSAFNPHYILLDSRAGLHDLGGLSLSTLAHLDVLVCRANEQNYRGLELTLQALGQRRSQGNLLCLLAHSFAPPKSQTLLHELETQQFRQRAYELFKEHIYEHGPNSTVPGVDDESARHYPCPIPYDPNLERIDRMSASLDPSLEAAPILELVTTLCDLCKPVAP